MEHPVGGAVKRPQREVDFRTLRLDRINRAFSCLDIRKRYPLLMPTIPTFPRASNQVSTGGRDNSLEEIHGGILVGVIFLIPIVGETVRLDG